MHGATIK